MSYTEVYNNLVKRLHKEKPSFGTELFYLDGLHVIFEYYKRFDGSYNITQCENLQDVD